MLTPARQISAMLFLLGEAKNFLDDPVVHLRIDNVKLGVVSFYPVLLFLS